MGRWSVTHDEEENKARLDYSEEFSVYEGYARQQELEELADAHNADCDAYEARIAELEAKLAKYEHAVNVGHPKPCDLGTLCPYCYIDHVEAELARVRADSLRVVPVGAKVPLDELWCDEYLIACQGRVYIREYDTDNFVELSDGPCLDVPEDTIVQPVRLERWEDEG